MGLDLLVSEIFGNEVDWNDNRLDDLLEAILTPNDKWALIFELGWDRIDSLYHTDARGCMRILTENLRHFHRREGFIAFARTG